MSGRHHSIGGLAAVFVFGAGNLIVAFSLPPEMHERAVSMMYLGFTTLAVASFLLAVALARNTSTKFLLWSLATMTCAGMLAYHAARNEITGTATYHASFGKHSTAEAVTRDSSPAKFRVATNLLWGAGIVCLGVAAVTFTCYRKCEW